MSMREQYTDREREVDELTEAIRKSRRLKRLIASWLKASRQDRIIFAQQVNLAPAWQPRPAITAGQIVGATSVLLAIVLVPIVGCFLN